MAGSRNEEAGRKVALSANSGNCKLNAKHVRNAAEYGIISAVKNVALVLTVLLSACVQAAWYWPFESSEDNTNKPPRLHRLLEKANDFIELAEDESLKGESDKALGYYRQALDELARVQDENPDRADTPEFAPLRNKIATCKAAVDTIRFEQINANVRAVSVTDTTELQRKWDRRNGIANPDAPAGAGTPPDDWNNRLKDAAERLRAGDYTSAEALLDKLAEVRPDDLDLLMLRGATLAGEGRLYAARKTLEHAASVHPKSYLPHYNLVYVSLDLGEGRKAAQRHYERGRELGGPVNEDLERRLKND